MTTKTKTPEALILEYFINGGTLTVYKALIKFNTTELRKIVTRLKRKGYFINSSWCSTLDANKNRIIRYKEYRLVNTI